MVSKLVLKHDVAFKTVFGSDDEKNQIALCSLLYALLGKKVKFVQITDNRFIDNSKSCVNLVAQLQSGRKVIVELEIVNPREDIMYEMMLDLYAIYGNQELKGDELDLGLKSSYKIGIADFVVDPDFEGLLTEFDLRNKKGQPLGRDLEIIVLKIIQLVKVPVMDPDQMSLLQKWCFFIKYYADDKKQDIIQELIRLEEGIAMADKIINRMDSKVIEKLNKDYFKNIETCKM